MIDRKRLAVFVAAFCAWSVHGHAADPQDTVLVTETGAELGLWRLSHSEPAPPFYSPLETPDHGGSVVFNDPTWVPTLNRPFVGDVNGDGLDDIVRVGFNPAVPGNGELFTSSHTVAQGGGMGTLNPTGTPDSWVSGDVNATAFFLADVNGDGYLDAVTRKPTPWDGGVTSFWEAKHSDASGLGAMISGTLVNSWSAGVLNYANTPTMGDFNGDGAADLAEYDSNGLFTVLLSTPGPNALPLPSSGFMGNTGTNYFWGSVGREPTAVTTLIGDVNGDGMDDVVEIDDRNGNGAWVWVVGYTGPDAGTPAGIAIGAGGKNWSTPFSPPAAGTTVQVPLLADMNGDGKDDIVQYWEFVDQGWTYGQWLVMYTNTDGTLGTDWATNGDSGTFRLKTSINDGNIPLIGQFGLPVPPEICDNGIDDDFDFLSDCADPDCKLTTGCNCYAGEDDTVLFNQGTTVPGLWWMSHTECAGSQPPFFNSNDDEWYFTIFNDATMTPNPNRPMLGDINGDGFDDIVRVGSNGLQEVFVASHSDVEAPGYAGLGSGYPNSFVGTDLENTDFFVADVDGDGFDDAITRKPTPPEDIPPYPAGSSAWKAEHSDATGLGGGGTSWAVGVGTQANTAIVGDFNGDGAADIAEYDATGLFVGIVSTLGVGLDGNNPTFWGSIGFEANHVATLIGDINGDGMDDIVQVDDRNGDGTWVWVAGLTGADATPAGIGINVGALSWSSPFSVGAEATFAIPLLGDVNNDGFDDLILYREIPVSHPDGTMAGQFLVSYTDSATGNLFNNVFNDQGLILLPTGYENNVPMMGDFDFVVPSEDCSNGIDDDLDGLVDCDDDDCTGDPACLCAAHDPVFDVDDDLDVDMDDFAAFQRCYTRADDPEAVFAGLPQDCQCMDVDGGSDIDSDDLLAFLACQSGPGVPASPTCDD